MSTAVTVIKPDQWYRDVPRSTKVHSLIGYGSIAAVVFGFGYWSTTADIAAAVVANGVFVSTGQNKVVQHLEGGVIKEILVREGDVVEPGQVMIRLDDTASLAELRRLALKHAMDLAMIARLSAEMRGENNVVFPQDPVAKEVGVDVTTIIQAQRLTFQARRKNLELQVAALQDSIRALEKRVEAGAVQTQSVQKQAELIREELAGKRTLVPGGLIRKSELLALERAKAGLGGEIGRLAGDIGDAKERIARSVEEIAALRAAGIKDAVEQLHTVEADLADVSERIRAAKSVLSRVEIKAPVRGIVVKLRYHTPGGVVEPGKAVLELVPLPENLLIEVRIRPQDIEHVKVGQEAAVKISALDQRTAPTFRGHLVYVSADALPDDQRPGQAADGYVARIRLDEKQPPGAPTFRAKPGMPAEVFIKTGERTFFEYLIKPVTDSMGRAFREY